MASAGLHGRGWEVEMDVLTEDVRKDVPGSMMFPNDIVLCVDDGTGITEYLET